MTLLKVKKAEFPFQGQRLVRGQEIDTADFPVIGVSKWWQLLDLGYLDLVDQPGQEILKPFTGQTVRISDPTPGEESRTRIRGVMNRTETIDRKFWTRDELREGAPRAVEEKVSEPPTDAPDVPLICSDCGHQAKNAHGLKVHVGRKHKE